MFSQTTEYALRAMACLALEPDRLVPTTVLASRTKVPGNYLAKVLQQLAAAKLISGRRGVGGGYRLARPADRVNMLEIVRAVGHIERIESCPLGISSHGSALCPLHRILDRAAQEVMRLFDGVSLQNLIEDSKSPNRPLCEDHEVMLTVSAGDRSGRGR